MRARDFLGGLFVGLAMNALAGFVALLPAPSNGLVLLMLAITALGLGAASISAADGSALANRLSVASVVVIAAALGAVATLVFFNPEVVRNSCSVCSPALMSSFLPIILIALLACLFVFLLWSLITRIWPSNVRPSRIEQARAVWAAASPTEPALVAIAIALDLQD